MMKRLRFGNKHSLTLKYLSSMSTPNSQSEHWHKVKQTAQEKIKAIHAGKEKPTNLPKWKELLKQAKQAFLKSIKII